MDCLFELDLNTFTAGAVSPLNSGWYLAIPDLDAYVLMLIELCHGYLSMPMCHGYHIEGSYRVVHWRALVFFYRVLQYH